MTCKDVQQLIRKAENNGWDVALTNGGHYRWQHPSGQFFFSAATPSYKRAIKKIKAQIRKIEQGKGFRR